MTEAINYFHSMFTFKHYSLTSFSKSENRLAHTLVKEGRDCARLADYEMKNGKTALNLAVDGKSKMLNQDLAKIALWHYERAADKYRRAVDGFEQSARIWRPSKRQRLMKHEAREMSQQAMKAESTVKFLNNFFKPDQIV
jgi:hypothetical protein